MMTGAIPVFLMPTRNNFGIIGPIPKSEFKAWESIQKKFRQNPFITDKTAKPTGADDHYNQRMTEFCITLRILSQSLMEN